MDGCEEHRNELILYLYGELEGADLEWIESHLESCERCANELEELKSTRESIKGKEEAGDVAEEVAARLKALARESIEDRVRVDSGEAIITEHRFGGRRGQPGGHLR